MKSVVKNLPKNLPWGVLGTLLLMSLLGCISAQSVLVKAGEMRAKYVVYSKRGEVITKGLTPNTVPLQKPGEYRFEITHPGTGEVFVQVVKGHVTLSPTSVEAPF